ncbi:MAG: hypothetical protein AB2719_16530 [Candidatus Thiodiazotropha sp.]
MFKITSVTLIILAITTHLGMCAENDGIQDNLAHLLEYPASKEDIDHIRNLLMHISSVYPKLKINLNSLPLSDDSINIIYFSSEQTPIHKTRYYKNNCLYKNEIKTVICDQAFVTKIMYYYDLYQERGCSINRPDGQCWHDEEIAVPATDEQIAESRRLFIYWILAHEIGHGYHEHEGQYFFATPEDSFGMGSGHDQNIALSQCQRNEIKADSFFASLSEATGESRTFRDFFEMLLILERKRIRCPNKSLVLSCDIPIGPIIPLPDDRIDVISNEKHPAFLIRLLLSTKSVKVNDETDDLYKSAINKFLMYWIKHYNDFIDPVFDCTEASR